MFVDEKDSSSKLILSHIYLLIGFSYPLWVSNFKEFNIAQMSGLITVGIGDSFASLIGSRYGKHKIPGCNKKSLEGSFALLFSQIFIFLILYYLNLFSSDLKNIVLISICAVSTSIIEAITIDNDNIILPIIAYSFLKFLTI